jgi:hypothetical protein
MNKVKIAVVAAGAAALAGGGTAIAAKGHNSGSGRGLRLGAPMMRMHEGGLGLDAAATYLGTTVDALRTQLEAGKTLAQIANATSGKSAQGLIDALVAAAKARLGADAPADLTQRITDMVNGVHDMRGMHGMHELHGGPFALRSQLESGKTLAQIANATSGKSAQGLIDALVADARTRITKLVNGS